MLVVRYMNGILFAYFRTLLCSGLLLSGDFTGYIRMLSPLILHTYIYIHICTHVHTVCLSGIMTENIVAPVAVILLGVMGLHLARIWHQASLLSKR